MYIFLIVLFVIVCILLTFLILIQSSKGGGLAGTFGGADSMGAVFGGRGAGDFLTKATGVLAALFMVIALLIGLLTYGEVSQESLVEQERDQRKSSATYTLPQAPSPSSPDQAPVPASNPAE
ncbi:MAG TPA: preprotein translocase subunit SecG [bacterium]|jgi:preprotein translocase subunit SecG|nr:preprotein translocase subunit SecG [bacterium]HNT64456.1 preprotein translocase subunit SecG [bacterium]HOX84697.1 preprotein translocase subunit SecG [bacterium]HPG45420.1 preprotein translocase subunit SecG [bacterium]HPM96804.1 preprotein translocase subunit SecG [bacterium]